MPFSDVVAHETSFHGKVDQLGKAEVAGSGEQFQIHHHSVHFVSRRPPRRVTLGCFVGLFRKAKEQIVEQRVSATKRPTLQISFMKTVS